MDGTLVRILYTSHFEAPEMLVAWAGKKRTVSVSESLVPDKQGLVLCFLVF